MSQKNKKNKSELLDFNLTIKKKDNNIYIYVLDLNLFAKGKNIEIAMINLHNQFEKLKINYQNFPELSIERKNSNIKFNNYNLVKSENNMDQFKETMIFIKPYISEIKKLIIN